MAIFDGKISLREIERKAFENETNEQESWVKEVLKHSAPQKEIVGFEASEWADKSKMNVRVRVEKVGGEYLVSGDFKATVPAGCSRCGDPFMVDRKSDFKVFLVPGNDPIRDVSDDPDYVFFYTDEIDLIDVLAEQLIVLEGVAEHPPCKEDGACQLCGKNPRFETEIPKEFVGNSAFSKLKDLKLKN